MTAGSEGRTGEHLPRVSVLMGVHNGAAHLDEAVCSILRQEYTRWELVIVDDGSTDETGAVLSRYDDFRIRIVVQEHGGLTSALIKAALAARGEYIARQDADDVSDPGRLAREVEYLDANPPVGLVGTAAGIIDETGERIGGVHVETEPEAIRAALEKENQFVHGSIMMRRNVYDEVGGYRPAFRYSQDYDLVLRIAELYKVANLSREYYSRRYTRDMISVSFSRQQLEYRDLARRLHEERMTRRHDRIQSGEPVPELDAIDANPGGPGEEGIRRYRIGYVYTCLRQGQARKARSTIMNQIKAEPFRARGYLHLAMTFLGDRAVAGILKRWDRRRTGREPGS